MKIETIYPKNWQNTRGIYSPAKKIDLGGGYLIFVSGQQARKINDSTGVFTDDVALQAESIFEQIQEILQSAGANIGDVVKAQIYVTNIKDFNKISPIRDKWFKKCKPVSTLIEVNGFTRIGAKVEIEVTAFINKQNDL